MKIKIFVLLYFSFCLVVYSTVLFECKSNMYSYSNFKNYKEKTIKELISKNFDLDSRKDLYENTKECLEITHIFNSFCHNPMIANVFHTGFPKDETKQISEEIKNDNSLYFLRLGYNYVGFEDNDCLALHTLKRVKNASLIEKAVLIRKLHSYYYKSKLGETKEAIQKFVLEQWENSDDPALNYFLKLLYVVFRDDVNRIYDNRKSKNGDVLYGGENIQVPNYFSFVEMCASLGNQSIRNDFMSNNRVTDFYTVNTIRDETTDQIITPWYEKAYKDLILEKYILDADFIFYAFRNSKNEIMIDLARKHIQNPEFKDARYKTVYYLVNHDFDYSFPILTKMVEDGSLHINEKKNFYRGLARLNKVPHSVLTKEQQQKANEYLKHQMLSEEDMSMKLYIDFLLSICVDEYGLSDERVTFLNGLKEVNSLSQDDIAQIDRRLKIIKYSIYMHSPSIFDSYVNGLKKEKPFIDINNVEWRNLPMYTTKANGKDWNYYDINSRAYIANQTNLDSCVDLIVPSSLDNYPVAGIAPHAFSGNIKIKNIILQYPVETIGYGAYIYNTNLLSLAIPNSVTNIGPNIFYQSPNLQYLYLEEGCRFTDEWFYDVYHGGGCLTPNCKIIRTKFENGLPVIPKEEQPNNN